MERRPYLNPHKDAELQRGKAADRFEAGPSGTVKAARIEPVVTRGRMRALGAGAWQSFKEWTSLQGNPSPYGTYGKERYRPPPISIQQSELSTHGVPFMFSNLLRAPAGSDYNAVHDAWFDHGTEDGRYRYDTVYDDLTGGLVGGFVAPGMQIDYEAMDEAHQNTTTS